MHIEIGLVKHIIMGTIFHVASEREWKDCLTNSYYKPHLYEQEGFIHCCTKDQLEGVLQRYYLGRTDLLLLHLDESQLEFTVKYEAATNNELFPHLYGMINKTAITATEKIN